MRHDPHSALDYLLRLPLGLLLLVTGIVFAANGAKTIIVYHSATRYWVFGIFALLWGAAALASFAYSVLNLLVSVEMDERGMYKKRFSRVLVELPWEQVQFAGACTKYSTRGMQRRFCFAPKVLNEEERTDLSVVEKSCIYFASLSEEEFYYIRRHLPIPLGEEINEFIRK